MQSQTSLNCTVNAGVDDNGEYNHCEWGIPSRDGWTVYEDAINYCLDDNDWWSQDGAPRACAGAAVGTDAVNPQRSANYPNGLAVTDQGGCCAACLSDVTCTSWVYDTQVSLDSAACRDWVCHASDWIHRRMMAISSAAAASADFFPSCRCPSCETTPICSRCCCCCCRRTPPTAGPCPA